jgi:CheY-like chemotaxis protein
MKDELHILLIEDDQDDVDLFRYALSANDVPCQLEIIMEGDLVAPYLRNFNQLPDIIVMDLNLPRVHGREVLQQIKNDTDFRDIPLVVLTTSSAQEDQKYCLSMGADSFITKPTTVKGFNTAIVKIADLAVANK